MALPVSITITDQVTVLGTNWGQGMNDWVNGAYGVLGAVYTVAAFNTALGESSASFTPTGISQTFTSATGTYFKKGKLVFVRMSVTWDVTASGAAAGIGSLPFAVVGDAGVSIGYFNSTKLPMGLFVAGASRLDLYQYFAGSPTMLESDMSTRSLFCSGCYLTT